MAQQIMGNRILGGIGSPGGGMATSYGEGVNTALNQRTTRQQMQERDQMMGLRATQEEREQERFRLGLQDRAAAQSRAAQAAAQAAQQRAALGAYIAGVQVPGAAPAGGAAPVGGVSGPAVRPPPAQLSPFPPAGGAPLSYGASPGLDLQNIEFLSGTLPSGTDPRGRMQLPGVPGVTDPMAAPPVLSAQEALNAQVAGLMVPEEGRRGPIQGAVDFFTRKEAEDAAARQAAGLPPLPTQAELGAQFGITVEEPAAPDTAQPAAAPTPVKETPWGGMQLDFGTPVQLTFGEEEGRGSEAFAAAPEKIFAQYDKVQQDRADLVRATEYYRAIGDVGNLTATVQQIRQLDFDSQYLDGMVAVVGIQQGNFGPLQELMAARYPGQQVEVRPYTDETVEIFVNGAAQARLPWADVAQGLRENYDTNYIEGLQAMAAEAASRDRFAFEKGVEATATASRDIAIEEARQMLNEGELRTVDATAEPPLYEMLVGGRRVTVTAVLSGDGKMVSLVPIDTSALR